jgi:hypothetical protein
MNGIVVVVGGKQKSIKHETKHHVADLFEFKNDECACICDDSHVTQISHKPSGRLQDGPAASLNGYR